MGYTPIDVNFDDNEQISELQGAELREETKRPVRQEKAKSQPAKKQTAKKAEPVSRAEAEEKRERRVTVRESAPVVKKEKKPRETPLAVSAVNGLRSIMSTRSNTRVRTVNNSRRKPIPISAIAMAFVCTALLMFMIVSYVQINEYTVEVSSLRSELGDMVERDKELSLEIEKKNDMLEIEKKAGELGMVKVDQLAKKHITLTQEDKIEVIEPEPTYDSTVVTTIMSSIWQNFAGLWEYLG